MYSHILVPLDGSNLAEQVLPYVKFLAGKFDSEVEIFQATPFSPTRSSKQAQSSHEYTRSIGWALEQEGLKCRSWVVEGNAVKEIIRAANADPSTLIVMSTRGHGGLAPGMLGSVVEGVLEETNNPLLIVRSQPEDTFTAELDLEELIVPLDGSTLAEFSLPHVIQLAQTGGLRVNLVRATPTVSRQEILMEYPSRDPDSTLMEVDVRAQVYIHSIAQRLRIMGVGPVEEKVLHGDPAVAIVEFAQQVPNNLVVMTTHGSSGIGRWALGSVTQLVECHCKTPVLVIRPERQYYDKELTRCGVESKPRDVPA